MCTFCDVNLKSAIQKAFEFFLFNAIHRFKVDFFFSVSCSICLKSWNTKHEIAKWPRCFEDISYIYIYMKQDQCNDKDALPNQQCAETYNFIPNKLIIAISNKCLHWNVLFLLQVPINTWYSPYRFHTGQSVLKFISDTTPASWYALVYK